MTLPTFLVIGAAKCGTDSLCNYLGQHPAVFIPSNREPGFFVAEGQTDVPYSGPGDRASLESGMWISTLERYEKLFSGVTSETAIGEGTAWYIYHSDAPARIHKYIPAAKLIAVLRNPVDRAYSAYTMLLRDGRETIGDFSLALESEEYRTRCNWDPMWRYVKMGFYSGQLKRYYATFDPSQLLIIVYDDYNARPVETMKKIFGFLDVNDTFTPDVSTRYNVAAVPRNRTLQSLVAGQYPLKMLMRAVMPAGLRQPLKRRIVEHNLTRPQPIDPAVRERLVNVFRDDVLELEGMLGRDLSSWLVA